MMTRTFFVDLLEVQQFRQRTEMAEAAALHVGRIITARTERRGRTRVVFACAPSQTEFLAALVRHPLDWSAVTIFHMDEYVGLEADHPQSFRGYLRKHLLEKIPQPEAVHYIAPEAEPEREAARYAALLLEKPIDLVCLGIGENGHLAFNDPHVADFTDPHAVKVVALDQACRRQQVHDGCFPAIDAVPTHAVTLTIPTLLAAHHISGVVPGERKARAVHDALRHPIETRCPASILRTHARALLHIDAPAAALLPP